MSTLTAMRTQRSYEAGDAEGGERRLKATRERACRSVHPNCITEPVTLVPQRAGMSLDACSHRTARPPAPVEGAGSSRAGVGYL